MRHCFERIITSIVGYSRQAQEVEGLRATVSDLHGRLDSLAEENRKLQEDTRTAWDMAHSFERERDEASAAKVAAEAKANALQEAIVARDSRVTDLESQLSALRAQVSELTADRDYWKRQHENEKAAH